MVTGTELCFAFSRKNEFYVALPFLEYAIDTPIYVCRSVYRSFCGERKKCLNELDELQARNYENLYNPVGNRGMQVIPYSVALGYHGQFSPGIILSAFVHDLEDRADLVANTAVGNVAKQNVKREKKQEGPKKVIRRRSRK